MTEQLKKIIREAGSAILDFYDDDIEVTSKDDDSPLTKADMAAHHIIMKGLNELDPDTPIISEEAKLPDYNERKQWDKFWLVDPLDGTKEFIKKNGEFTVNIALIENKIPILGLVYLPAKKVLYMGSKGQGSFKEKDGEEPVRIYSQKAVKPGPMTVITSRSHKSDDLEDKLKAQNIEIGNVLQAGSSLKICFVAEGKADIYPRMGPTMEWDVAAGDAVFRYSDKEGDHDSPLSYNKETLKNDGFIIGL